jgi:hypothetical protein
LQPTALKAISQRRQQNKIYQALGRYASLRLNSEDLRPGKTSMLLDLCRHELGLKYIDVTVANGARLMVSPEDLRLEKTHDHFEMIVVKAAGGEEDIVVGYEFKHTPNPIRRQDVSLCLASIFEGLRLGTSAKTAGATDVVSPGEFKAVGVAGKQGARQ